MSIFELYKRKRHERFEREQRERMSYMNKYADRAVDEVIHSITARIGTVELRSMIDVAEARGDRYVTLTTLLADQIRKVNPDWRKL